MEMAVSQVSYYPGCSEACLQCRHGAKVPDQSL